MSEELKIEHPKLERKEPSKSNQRMHRRRIRKRAEKRVQTNEYLTSKNKE